MLRYVFSAVCGIKIRDKITAFLVPKLLVNYMFGPCDI